MNKRMEEKKVLEAALLTITKIKELDDMPNGAYNALTAVEKSLVGLAGLMYDTDYTVISDEVKRSVFEYQMMELDASDFLKDAAKTSWSPFEVERLKELVSLGVAWSDIAGSLHRTVAACRSKYEKEKRKLERA